MGGTWQRLRWTLRLRLSGPGGGRRRISRSALRAAIALSALSIPITLAAANVVAESRAGQHEATAAVNDVKPADCASLTLSSLYAGAGTLTGGATSDLILGGATDQTISGGDGDDCILGGGGNDQINGGAGTDVCIGGPGTDSFGADCETQVEGNPTF